MSDWIERIHAIEALEDAEFDRQLVSDMAAQAQRMPLPAIRFSTPTFKEYDTGRQGSWMVQLTDTPATNEGQN